MTRPGAQLSPASGVLAARSTLGMGLPIDMAMFVIVLNLGEVAVESDGVVAPQKTTATLNLIVQDLVLVITAWGTANSKADVNGDGVVDVLALIAVITGWGSCR